MIHLRIHTFLVGSEVGSFVGSLVGSDVGVVIFGKVIVGRFDVVENPVRFLIVENFLLICTVSVDGTNCAN